MNVFKEAFYKVWLELHGCCSKHFVFRHVGQGCLWPSCYRCQQDNEIRQAGIDGETFSRAHAIIELLGGRKAQKGD